MTSDLHETGYRDKVSGRNKSSDTVAELRATESGQLVKPLLFIVRGSLVTTKAWLKYNNKPMRCMTECPFSNLFVLCPGLSKEMSIKCM